MWGGVCWLVAALQVGLGAAWGPRAEPSTANWSAGSDPPSPSPLTWTTPLPRSTASSGAAAPGEQEPPACRGEEDCPPWSSCEEQAGRNSCRCGLGYHLSPTLGCVPVKAFPGRLLLWDSGSPDLSLPGITSAESQLPWVTLQIQRSFQHILGHLDGYLGSSARDLTWPSSEVTLFHHFSARAPVTSRQVAEAVATFRAQCHESSHMGPPACALLRKAGPYQSLSLCLFDVCDSLSTSCSFQDGLLRCTCRPGHFQAHPADRTCAECSSGFWLQNGTCTRCPFGFGGAGCQEPFLLALVVVSGLAGLLLLLLIAGSLSRSTRPPKEDLKETPEAPQLPLHASSTLSLPRVRPPWTLEEAELRRGDRLSLWGPDVGQRPANAPRLKTFLGSSSSLPSPPQPLGGCHNLVFVSDAAEEKDRRSYF
ncbi:Hypothetical predicted protein [Podarcis lilfordi]|uniref:EGF-like domain-containing protein n=1 Tax=Podarcis lilfordi TaxID=74358 RepID=A0AA35PHT8_9SAUR|nr:Hypothetical predicted protein [Podarcis lilfordi]